MKTIRYVDFIDENIAPYGIKKIGLYNSKGKRIGEVDIGNLNIPDIGLKQYSFGAISDIHLQDNDGNTAKSDFQKALTYYNNDNKIDFVCICGDLTNDGSAKQLTEYKQYVDTYINKPIYAITGNHETYAIYHNPNEFGGLTIPDVIQEYTSKSLYYSFTQGNDVFIMLGIVGEYDLFTNDELQWLYNILETNRNKRCFIFQHVFAGKEKEVVCGNPYGLYHNYCWSNTTQTTIFESLMEHYKNAIWFHGHSHFRFNLQSKDCAYANIDKSNGYWSVHIPSISVPREDANGDGNAEYYTAGSEGYIVDVYSNHIVLRGRDFVKGEFLPIATYCLDTTLQTVEANTFIDNTGTIVT